MPSPVPILASVRNDLQHDRQLSTVLNELIHSVVRFETPRPPQRIRSQHRMQSDLKTEEDEESRFQPIPSIQSPISFSETIRKGDGTNLVVLVGEG